MKNTHYLDSFMEVVFAARDFRMNHTLVQDCAKYRSEIPTWLAKSRAKLEMALALYVYERDTILKP